MWVLFDLNGTLVDPSVLAEPAHAAHEALDEANMMAMVATLGGLQPAFADLLEGALRRRLALAGAHPAPAALDRLAEMPAYPDAPAALERLRAGGCRLAVLTQSSSEAAERVLRNSGLRAAFDLVLSAPETGAYKPTAATYRRAVERAGAQEAWFVAGHWWDGAGGGHPRPRTAWGRR